MKKHFTTVIFFFSFAIIAVLTGCHKDKGCREWEQTTIEPQALLNTKWKCTGFVNAKSCMIKKSEHHLNFYEDGTLSGCGCNVLVGNYKIDFITGNINIHNFITSEVLCPPEANEKLYVETLNKVQFFSLQGNELRLYYNNKNNYLLFKRL